MILCFLEKGNRRLYTISAMFLYVFALMVKCLIPLVSPVFVFFSICIFIILTRWSLNYIYYCVNLHWYWSFNKIATFVVFQVEVASQELMEQDIEVEERLDVGNPQLYAGND